MIILALEYALYKYCMFIKYIKPYEILFFEGLIVLILSVVTLIITTKFGDIDNFWNYYENLNSKEIIIFISSVLINFFYSILLLLIIDIFSPFYILLVDFIAEYFIIFS